jgi:hypothetical protein
MEGLGKSVLHDSLSLSLKADGCYCMENSHHDGVLRTEFVMIVEQVHSTHDLQTPCGKVYCHIYHAVTDSPKTSFNHAHSLIIEVLSSLLILEVARLGIMIHEHLFRISRSTSYIPLCYDNGLSAAHCHRASV